MEIFNSIITLAFMYLGILTLSSISSIISERVGIVNIGVNGTIVFGATIYMIFASIFSSRGSFEASSWLQIPLFIISGLAGIAFSSLHGYATIKLKANQIISGVAMNILAPAMTLLVLFVFGEAGRMNYNVPELAIGNNASAEITGIFSLSSFVMILVVVVSMIMLNKTSWGLRLKSVGENPQASDAAGINVNSFKWQGVLISGLLAGFAGAMFMASTRTSGNTFQGSVEGLGFLSLAIMIVGRWKIIPSLFVSVAFSFLLSISYNFTQLVPKDYSNYQFLVLAVPYVVTLIAMVAFAKGSIGPKAAGIPYDKTLR
ncbi:MAG: ABC transporter permease [Mycoplasmataceae bacterium]|nr:ABC transporter permease [Mycoplasmataceae bacterium]